MKLLPEWRRIIRRAWSVRLALLAGILSGAEFGVQLLATAKPTPWLALAGALCGVGATVARLLVQPDGKR